MYRALDGAKEIIGRFMNPPDPATVGRVVVAYDPEISIVEVFAGEVGTGGECQEPILLTMNTWALEPGSYSLYEYRADADGEWPTYRAWSFDVVAGEVGWFNLMDIEPANAEDTGVPAEPEPEPEPEPGEPEPEPEPAPTPMWYHADIGDVSDGSSDIDNGVITLAVRGNDVWFGEDGVRFRYREVEGDFDIWAKVAALTEPHWSAKAGLMIRASLDADSAVAFAYSKPPGGAEAKLSHRPEKGGLTSHVNELPHPFPMWLRFWRRGNEITAAVSDVHTGGWQEIGKTTIVLPDKVYVGLAATIKKEANAIVEAKFEGLSFVKAQ